MKKSLIATGKQCVKRAMQSLGIEIRRYDRASTPDGQVEATLRHLGIDLVLDVGANTGQYAQALRESGYRGRIVSFEPLSDAHASLLQNAKSDPSWTIHERCALGSKEGQSTIHVAGNSFSSSLLPMLDKHANAAPESAYVDEESVAITTLDAVIAQYARPGQRVFLKVDTQGYEAEVLAGATNSLSMVVGLQLELSLTPLYKGQHLWDALIDQMKNQGFQVWTILPGFSDTKTGQGLQVDAILYRPEMIARAAA